MRRCPLAVFIYHGLLAVYAFFDLPITDPTLGLYTRLSDTANQVGGYFCTKCGVRVIHTVEDKYTVIVRGGWLEGLSWENAKHCWRKRTVVSTVSP